MERLTIKTPSALVGLKRGVTHRKAMARLSDYEDKGFSPSEIKDMHNELCLKCGNYEREHLGACNGCRWKKEG